MFKENGSQFEHMPWSIYEKVLWLSWMREALIEAMKVLKVYEVATTSTFAIVPPKVLEVLWQEILKVYM